MEQIDRDALDAEAVEHMTGAELAAVQTAPQTTAITFTNEEWCQIHMAVLARRQYLIGHQSYPDSLKIYDNLTEVAVNIHKQTRNFYGVE